MAIPSCRKLAGSLPTLLALCIGLLAAPAARGQDSRAIDAEMRAAYGKIEAARGAMNADLSEEENEKRMRAYQDACRDFIAKYKDIRGAVVGRFDLGRAYVESFDPAAAEPHFRAFLAAVPDHADAEKASLFLADVCRAQGKIDEAVGIYERFLAERPRSGDIAYARLGLATCKVLAMKFDEAAAICRTILEKHGDQPVAADARLQLVNAAIYGGHFDEAREVAATIAETQKESPDFQHLAARLELLGRPAPELTDILAWSGVPGVDLSRLRGRVVVLCFMMIKNLPSVPTMHQLSRLETELALGGVTVWGLVKAVKTARGETTLEAETREIDRYRSSPRPVLEAELSLDAEDTAADPQLWTSLERPITASIGLTRDTSNHRAYAVRRVPTVVVIDKKGLVRLIEEGSQPEGSFQSQLVAKLVRELAAEKD